ncbi:ThiS-like ubiquitin domain-containing protein [Bacillaceae bacterium C204]|uniref:ThiS-like ubiquitin domain-containing protein n=1 Tax=Neobacillus sp. 204 TaxID=3383351 RepID=UPI00397C9B86
MNITINGKEIEIACQTAFEVREQIGNPTDIVILNGFQIEKDSKISENDGNRLLYPIEMCNLVS